MIVALNCLAPFVVMTVTQGLTPPERFAQAISRAMAPEVDRRGDRLAREGHDPLFDTGPYQWPIPSNSIGSLIQRTFLRRGTATLLALHPGALPWNYGRRGWSGVRWSAWVTASEFRTCTMVEPDEPQIQFTWSSRDGNVNVREQVLLAMRELHIAPGIPADEGYSHFSGPGVPRMLPVFSSESS